MLFTRLKEKSNYILIFSITVLLFHSKGIFDFLGTKSLAGTDLIGNYAYQWYLHNRLLPNFKLTGWSNLWFAGVPVLTFYPPLLFICTSMLSYLSFGLLPLKLTYKLVIFGSLLFFPPIVYYSMKKLDFGKIKSLLVSFWVIAFLFLYGKLNAIHQTLNFGLVTQMFGLNLLILFIGELCSRKTFWKPGILFSLVILSHTYVSLLALIAMFILLTLNPTEKTVEYLTPLFIIGILLSSFWLGPVLSNLQFVEYFGREPSPLFDFPFMLAPFLLLSFYRPKNRELLMILIFLATFFIGIVGTPFRLQHNRFFFYSILFGSMLAGLGSFRVYKLFKDRIDNRILVSFFLTLLVATPILPVFTDKTRSQWESSLELEELNRWIKRNIKQGRILTESNRDLGWEYYILMENIPIKTGVPVLNELHVDSSLSSPYTLALQYEISPRGEINPICQICKFVHRKAFDRSLFLSQLDRYNVKFIIATTKYTQSRLRQFLVEKRKIGKLSIFEVPGDDKYYEILEYKPILVVSDLNSWKKFNTLIFVDRRFQNLTFVWSDGTQDLKENYFSGIILLKDENIKTTLPVFKIREGEQLSEFINRISSLLEVEESPKGRVTNFAFDNEKLIVEVDSKEKIPILLKFSYSPKLKTTESVYLTNPSIMTLFINGSKKIWF